MTFPVSTRSLHIVYRIVLRSKVDPNGCLIWKGATTPRGDYGVVGRGGRKNGLTHRVMYEHFVGPIPPGYQIDHLCGVTLCCNPTHLEAVTQQENLRRQHAAITHCIRGHSLLDEANVYRPPGQSKNRRMCRACIRLRSSDPEAKSRAAARRAARRALQALARRP